MIDNPQIDAVVQVPLLDAPTCRRILAVAEGLSWQAARINVGEDAPDARSCETVSLSESAREVLGSDTVGQLVACVLHFNDRCWNFALGGGMELNLLRYRVGDHYNRWHTDVFAEASTRKLSFTLQLSTDYEGGTLRMQEMSAPASNTQGDLILFPAFMAHRVEPVTEGVRTALVGWMHGPPFV